MSWFKRVKEGIVTRTDEKKEAPDGLFLKCPACKKMATAKVVHEHFDVCTFCGHHNAIGSKAYFHILFDEDTYTELDEAMESANPLSFTDTKAYPDRLKATQEKTGHKDAIRTAYGKINGEDLVVACMDFDFIGGSMGSVMGEKIARAIDHAVSTHTPLLIISRSGGARMMEGALSLMQMAKTSAKLALLARAGIPYFSLMTDPTTGGVTASFAMLGDFNIAEPNALIGFAGPRVIKETIGKDLPKGFQRAEFLLEKGFLDFIVERKDLKQRIALLISMLKPEVPVAH